MPVKPAKKTAKKAPAKTAKKATAPPAKPADKKPSRSGKCTLPGGDLLDQGMSVQEVMETLESSLTLQEEKFCREYVSCNVAVRAAMRVWPEISYDNAHVKSSRLLQKVTIQARIAQITEEHKERYSLTDSKVLKRLSSLVHFDRRSLHNPDGTIKQIHEMTEEEAAAIVEIESVELFEGRGDDRQAVGIVRKVKFADPHKSIEMAGKHLKLWKEVGSTDNPLNSTVSVAIEM